jgi:hypothetical protein
LAISEANRTLALLAGDIKASVLVSKKQKDASQSSFAAWLVIASIDHRLVLDPARDCANPALTVMIRGCGQSRS